MADDVHQNGIGLSSPERKRAFGRSLSDFQIEEAATLPGQTTSLARPA